MSARVLWLAAFVLVASFGSAASLADEAPRPALTAAKAVEGRLLGIAKAGEHLIAVGQQGVILQSSDGKTWTQVSSPVSAMLTRVRFADAQHGWIVGYDSTVLATRDAGASWQLQHFDTHGRALFDVLFTDPQHGIAVGAYGTLMLTSDGGAHWSEQTTSALSELALHLNAIIRLGDGSLLITGERGLLALSNDGGNSWRLLKSPYVGSWFGALPYGDKGALVYGLRGHVFETRDVSTLASEQPDVLQSLERQASGATPDDPSGHWRQLVNPVMESLFGAARVSTDEAVLVGVNGAIARVNLPAAELKSVEKLSDEPLSEAVRFNGNMIVVGRRGVQNLGVLP